MTTRNEEILKAAHELEYPENVPYFVNGAEWADKHPSKESLRSQNRCGWNDVSIPPKYPCDILFKYPNGNMFIFRYLENGRKNDAETPIFSSLEDGEWIYLDNIKPRSHWKPSEEQMKGIECAIKTLQHQLNVGDKRLNLLYDDLKKLREE